MRQKSDDIVIVEGNNELNVQMTPLLIGGMITLYGTGFDVRGTDWNWLASWHYADGTTGANPDDYYGWRGYNDPCTPAKPIPLDSLVFSITVGSWEYGYSGLGSFGPFKVEDGKSYVIDVITRTLSER